MLGNLKVPHGDTEKPWVEMSHGSETESPSSEGKGAMTLSRLRESFSLHQSESYFQSPKKVKQRHSSTKQLSLDTILSTVRTRKAVLSEDSESCRETKSKMSVPRRYLREVEENTDSGFSSTSGSDAGYDTPEAGSCVIGETVNNPVEEEFCSSEEQHQSQCRKTDGHGEKSLEGDIQVSGTEHKLNGENDWNKQSNLPQEASNSLPRVKCFRSEADGFKAAVHPEVKNTRNSMPCVDVLVEVKKKTVPLEFSMKALAERVRKIVQQQQKCTERQNYRRFRAKISPGENKVAEDELRKEIRYFSAS